MAADALDVRRRLGQLRPAGRRQAGRGRPRGPTGADLRVGDTLLYDIVHEGLTEKDPTTTNWEDSKPQMATGEIATMWLGSWAIIQIRTPRSRPARTRPTSGSCPSRPRWTASSARSVAPDYNQAVNIHSKHKAAARAWIDWFTDKSGYAEDNLAISPVKGAPLPDGAAAVRATRASKLIELTQAEGRDGQGDRQRVRGRHLPSPTTARTWWTSPAAPAKGSLDDFFADLEQALDRGSGSLGS